MEIAIQLIIRSAQKGNKKAFRKLIEHYDERIFALIYRFASNGEIAKDIYQEVFMNVYKNLDSFNFKSDFYTWLYRITVNTSLKVIQKEKKHIAYDIEDLQLSKEYEDNKFVLEEILQEAKKLPGKQKLGFFMRFQNDMKISEVAEAMSIDIGTVKGYLSRSIKKIREKLEIY